jgi:hypothetical protein
MGRHLVQPHPTAARLILFLFAHDNTSRTEWAIASISPGPNTQWNPVARPEDN